MKFKTEDGTIVDDALIEEMAEAWDCGEVPGVGSRVRRGRPRLANEEVSTISFKAPISLAEEIAKAAKASGESQSSFLRAAAHERADKILAAL